jgi:two-component system sensor histidine kinase BarA
MYTGSNSNNGPVIDLELGARLAGNKSELAKELLFFLVKNLPKDLQEIQQAHTNNNNQQLKNLVHKLHGAASYCGTPRLRHALAEFEAALKKNETATLDSFLADLTFEAAQLIQEATEIGARIDD